jgi:small conductance mechanosensitive channel
MLCRMRIHRLVRLGLIVAASVLLTATAWSIAQTIEAAPTVDAAPTTRPDDSVSGFIDKTAERFNQMKIDDLYDPRFWVEFGKDAVYWTIAFVPRLIVALFILAFFWLFSRVVRKIIIGSMKAAGVDESIRDMLGAIIKWVLLGFALIIAGNQIGLQIAALLTGVSIIGLAVGFAAQESLGNFIAGIMIFLDKPFRVGDWIEIDGHLGQVQRVTFRSTRILDLDGDLVVMPNMTMLSHKLINKSSNPITRVRVPVGIAYKESIDRARQALLQLVGDDPRIEKSPPPLVVVRSLAASSVDLELKFWIRDERYENAMLFEFTEKAKNALDAAAIEIPFPHVQLVNPS